MVLRVRIGLALRALIAALLIAAGGYFGIPWDLSGRVVTVQVLGCSWRGVCAGTWTDGAGRGHYIRVEGGVRAGKRVRVRLKGDDAGTTYLRPAVGGWIVRGVLGVGLTGGGVLLAVSAVRRWRAYTRERREYAPSAG